jgi:hypothetical protein
MKPVLPECRPGQRRFAKVPDHIRAMILKEHPTISYLELSKKYNLSNSVLWYIRNNVKFPSKYKKNESSRIPKTSRQLGQDI